jgi:predicted metal-dependent hydrolase
MGQKSLKIAQMVAAFRDQGLDCHYLAYFDCFNRQLFFEAHEVLEQLWLPERQQANGPFYQGLIQLAGAFVHVQKARRGPARALLNLAKANLSRYPERHQSLHLPTIRSMIDSWLRGLESGFDSLEVEPGRWPQIEPPSRRPLSGL